MAQIKKVDQVAKDLEVEPVVEDPKVEPVEETKAVEEAKVEEKEPVEEPKEPIVEPEPEVPVGKVKIELVEVTEGTQTIFTSGGSVSFEDGVAVVSIAIANELRQYGQIK